MAVIFLIENKFIDKISNEGNKNIGIVILTAFWLLFKIEGNIFSPDSGNLMC